MQAAVSELEKQFARCTSDLDLIAKKLDKDFDANKAYSKNPVQLLERVKALQNDLPRVQEDWQRVMVAKQTIIDIARSQQMASHRALKQLNTAACLRGPQDEDEEPFQHFKGIHARWEKENSSRVASMQEELYGHMLLTPEELNIEVLRTADVRNTHDIEEAVGAEREGGVGDCDAAADGSASLLEGKQEDKKIGHSISEAEFLSVSNIVRGRCKREECNELLELLIVSASKAKKGRNGQIQPLTTAVLVRMGARVTGQTGGSRLATLRCLKRITISKEGVMLNKDLLS